MRIAAIIAAMMSKKDADGRPAPPIGQISALDAHENLVAGELLLIDVRQPSERAATGAPEGAEHASLRDRDFLQQVARLAGDFERPVAFISERGQRSMQAAMQARAAGFVHLFSVTGGYRGEGGWIARGLPAVAG
ncbi:rhodanese-like domain-containing protein [Hyphomonas sp.]|uniref:rhodanese-like domain-containing protein n=1 Tax=Hyphomonas sp. TaxID=87 RepID=UPI00391B4A18